MPALRPVIGVARCVAVGQANGIPVVNVFHVRNGDVGATTYNDAGIQALATAMATSYKTRLIPLMNASYLGDTLTCTDLTTDTGSSASALINIAGTNTSPSTPASVSTCLSWRTNRHYRGGHGRTYLYAPAATNITSPTTLSGTFVSSCVTAGNGWISDIAAIAIGGTNQQFVIVHRIRNNAVLDVPLVDKVTSCTVDTRIDSQRRRLGRDR